MKQFSDVLTRHGWSAASRLARKEFGSGVEARMRARRDGYFTWEVRYNRRSMKMCDPDDCFDIERAINQAEDAALDVLFNVETTSPEGLAAWEAKHDAEDAEACAIMFGEPEL